MLSTRGKEGSERDNIRTLGMLKMEIPTSGLSDFMEKQAGILSMLVVPMSSLSYS